MRVLGINDKKDYEPQSKEVTRVSARCIVIEDGKIYLSHSRKFNFYKLPGGGVDRGETKKDSAMREAREEAGVFVDRSDMKLWGVYIDKWKSVRSGEEKLVWVNKSYYYICKRIGELLPIEPTESEKYDEAESVLVNIDEAIEANILRINSPEYSVKERYLERENEIFKLIKEELL